MDILECIEQLLRYPQLSPQTKADLKTFKHQAAKGCLPKADANYITKLHARLLGEQAQLSDSGGLATSGGRMHQSTPKNWTDDRQQLLELFEGNVRMQQSMHQNVPPEGQSFIRGQAMAQTMFVANQRFGQKVGIFGTIGGAVKRLSERFHLEVVPFAHLDDEHAGFAIVEYIVWRFDIVSNADVDFIKESVRNGLSRMAGEQREGLMREVRNSDVHWYSLI